MTIYDDVVAQCEQTLDIIEAALREAGATLADVVRITYSVPDPNDFKACWPSLQRRFGAVRPAATMLSAKLLDPRIRVCVSKTSPATTTASTPSLVASAASRSTALKRASESDTASSGSNEPCERPICQSAVCRSLVIVVLVCSFYRPRERSPSIGDTLATMERRALLSLGLAPLGFMALARGGERAGSARHVLGAALAFGLGGGYDTKWTGTGVPEEVMHRGDRVLAKSASGTYCCGFTFAVAMRVLAAGSALDGKSVADVRAFQKAWYGATKETAERQCAQAVEGLGVGREVPLDEARAGDFAQLWRVSKQPSGHSVLFLAWIELEGRRVGFNYLSSQGSTNGIGYSAEYFADAELGKGRVDRTRLYFARLG